MRLVVQDQGGKLGSCGSLRWGQDSGGGICVQGLQCQARCILPLGLGLERGDLWGLWEGELVSTVSQSTGEGASGLVWGMPGWEGFLDD